jgi:hypothetical protein
MDSAASLSGLSLRPSMLNSRRGTPWRRGLLKRQRRPAVARFIGAATAPLALMTRAGDKRIVPLADPARGAKGPAWTIYSK